LHTTFGGAALKEADCQMVCDVVDTSFSRSVRLLKPIDYKKVFESSTRVSTRYLTLLARDNAMGVARLGLAISRKNVKRAVDRNRIKRHVRESFRHNQLLLSGLDIVVMVRGGMREFDWSELRESLDSKWRELRKRCRGF
jgi:ribonuclease P protein component